MLVLAAVVVRRMVVQAVRYSAAQVARAAVAASLRLLRLSDPRALAALTLLLRLAQGSQLQTATLLHRRRSSRSLRACRRRSGGGRRGKPALQPLLPLSPLLASGARTWPAAEAVALLVPVLSLVV